MKTTKSQVEFLNIDSVQFLNYLLCLNYIIWQLKMMVPHSNPFYMTEEIPIHILLYISNEETNDGLQ